MRDGTATGGKASVGIMTDEGGWLKRDNLKRRNKELKHPTCRLQKALHWDRSVPTLSLAVKELSHHGRDISMYMHRVPIHLNTTSHCQHLGMCSAQSLILGQYTMAYDSVLTCSFQIQVHRKRRAPFSQKGCLIHKHAFYSFAPLWSPPVPQNWFLSGTFKCSKGACSPFHTQSFTISVLLQFRKYT